MKNLITILVVFINCMAFGQIKVIETTPIIRLGAIGQNDMYIQTEGDKYTFFYKNIEKEEEITTRSFMFRDLNDDIQKLEDIILAGFTADPLLDIKLELPNDYVWLHYSKNLDRTYVQFMCRSKDGTISGVSKSFNLEQVVKMFEKKLPKK